MIRVYIFALAIALAACAKSGQEDKGGKFGGGGVAGDPSGKLEVVTDTGACSRGPAAMRLEGGRWQMNFRQGELELDTVFEFGDGYLSATNTCRYHGLELTVRTGSPIWYDDSRLRVYDKGHAWDEIEENGTRLSCEVTLEPFTAAYGFSGSCLVLRDPKTGEVMTFAPKW